MNFAHAVLALVLAAPLTGCVSMSRYNEALNDASQARQQEVDVEQRAQALAAQVDGLAKDLHAREVKLGESNVELSNLKKASDDLVIENAEISRRLKAAGQSVQQLASERGSLSVALADTKRKLEELSRLEAAAQARAAEMKAISRSFQAMVDAGKLRVVLRSGRLVIELPNDVLFDSGKTALKDSGKTSLIEVAKVVRTLRGKRFEVAGHTDDVAIASPRFPSNWELSTARAVTVTKLLVEQGVDPKTLSAAGYGEFAPLATNTTAEGRAKNRRIEIALVPVVDEKMIGR